MACASLSFNTPESVNLSGEWVVDPAVSQRVIFPVSDRTSKRSRAEAGGQSKGRRGAGERGGEKGGRGKGQRSKEAGSEGPQTAVNSKLSNADEMTIDHIGDSMGILYLGGKYRDIDWGKVERRNQTITAGWQGEALVVKISGGSKTITETYSLDESGSVLTINFKIGSQAYVRVYNRKVDGSQL